MVGGNRICFCFATSVAFLFKILGSTECKKKMRKKGKIFHRILGGDAYNFNHIKSHSCNNNNNEHILYIYIYINIYMYINI